MSALWPRNPERIFLAEPGDPPPPRHCRVCQRGFWIEGGGRPYVTCSDRCHRIDVRRLDREEMARRRARAAA